MTGHFDFSTTMRSLIFSCLVLCLVPAPLLAQGTAPAAKAILSGDILRITIDESPDLDGVYTVAGDGTIDLQYAGRISVDGKSVEDVAAHLKNVLEASIFKKATVTVEISEYYSGNIMLLGAVSNPGNIPYKGNEVVTLLEAVINAGGLTERAAGDQVKIFRWKTGGAMERQVITVDLNAIMKGFDFSKDQYLRPRDIVVVPELGASGNVSEFLALGEFSSTGFYPVSGDLNMIRAVSLAGGVSKEANLENARILRPSGDGNYTVIPVDLARLFGAADMKANVQVFAGDILFVPSASQGSSGKVYFLGEVDNPGMFPLPVGGGMATLARTILQRGGLGKFSDASAIKIQRKSPDGTTKTVVFNADKILKSGDFEKDMPLQDEDVIMVPGKLFSF